MSSNVMYTYLDRTCSSERKPGSSLVCLSGKGITMTVSGSHCCNRTDSSKLSLPLAPLVLESLLLCTETTEALFAVVCMGLTPMLRSPTAEAADAAAVGAASSEPGVLGVEAAADEDLLTAALTAVDNLLDSTCLLAIIAPMVEFSPPRYFLGKKKKRSRQMATGT